jgi:hypothetical protein
MSPESPCGPSTAPGGFAAAVIVLLEKSSDVALLCSPSSDGGGPGTNTGRILDLEIATAQYAAMATPITDALAPGSYVVGDEHQDDPDLCMLPTGTTAFLQLVDAGGGYPTSVSASGTVSITSVSGSAIAGTFNVTMGGPFGQTDGGTPQLTGSFDATSCP